MNAVAEKYADRDIASVFVYTNEAHPGERFPHHRSMEDKYRHANALRDELGVIRPIFLDALNGSFHRTLGGMPNMTWIFGRTGMPVYKSDWTDAHSVANSLDYLLDVAQRRRGGERLAAFRVERLDYRDHDRVRFYEGLDRSGPRAVAEFEAAFSQDRRPKG